MARATRSPGAGRLQRTASSSSISISSVGDLAPASPSRSRGTPARPPPTRTRRRTLGQRWPKATRRISMRAIAAASSGISAARWARSSLRTLPGRGGRPRTASRTCPGRRPRSRSALATPRARPASCIRSISGRLLCSVGATAARPHLSHTRTLKFPPAERPASAAKRSRLGHRPRGWSAGPSIPRRRGLRSNATRTSDQ